MKLESSNVDYSDEEDDDSLRVAVAYNIGALVMEGICLGLWPSPPEDFQGISFLVLQKGL